jgi:ferric-dicitrate binding protein FerR (iron transport regulator)
MDDRAARVRAHVHAAWKGEVDRRRERRRRVVLTTIRGLVAAAVVTVVVARPARLSDPVLAVATVERTEGDAPVAPGARIDRGDEIVTGRGTRVALRRVISSIRLDEHTHARFISHHTIELIAGAIYVDSNGVEDPIEIVTPIGNITDIGTQFEVRVLPKSVRVRVRSGSVAVRRERESIKAAAGSELMILPSGIETRVAPVYGGDWSWTSRLARPFAIEGQRLHAYLTYLAHENGWTLRYADAGVQRLASSTVLHGSVEGLDPEAALGVALTIAHLSHTLEDGDLRIWRLSSR